MNLSGTDAHETITVDVYHMLPFTMPSDPGVGNPATVVIVNPDQPISIQTMAYIARKLGQPETVFTKQRHPGIWEVRWFTPGGNEINPGGNSTVALGHLLAFHLEANQEIIHIKSQYSWLDSSAQKQPNGMVQVTFPSVAPSYVEPTQKLLRAFNFKSTSFYKGDRDLIAIFPSELELRNFTPNYEELAELRYFAVIAAAPGQNGLFGYRTFITTQGEIFEDIGSAGSLMNLASLFYPLLGQPTVMHADQLSALGGEAFCELKGDKLFVSAFCDYFSGPNSFTFPMMGGELLCQKGSCSDQFIWI
ncbi:PhzF family phenazine biosynthesis protein [soil metagenome]